MDGLLPGFPEPVLDSQRVFRAVLDAMALPGSLADLPLHVTAPAPLDAATAAVLLALADVETPVWLDGASDNDGVRRHLRFHCGCPLTPDAGAADFAVVTEPAAMPALSAFKAGTDEYPDRSATLVVQVPTLSKGERWTLSGPGIRDRAQLSPGGLPAGFRDWLAENRAAFPRGVDVIFTSGRRLAALPRTTRLEG
ncbi:MAG TPA: phosphonate C-P lyase system protein PhnH [Azospirillum sp.]|nr:phosphonate C-P lyase system protein PhnH [Azospirillum sp.]